MKKVFQLFAVLFTTAVCNVNAETSVWDGHSYSLDWYTNGSGVTYHIKTAADLAGLSRCFSTGYYLYGNFAGRTIILENDIDLNGYEWTPIGIIDETNTYFEFAGTFDGNNHTIKGLSITRVIDNPYIKFAGLFGYCPFSDSFSVKNLKVEGSITLRNVNISNSSDIYVGGIVGYTGTASAIENCQSNVNITVDMMVGSFAEAHCGGVIGFISNSERTELCKNCYSKGNINVILNNSNDANVGGIIGGISCGNAIVSSCLSDCDITVSNGRSSHVGGIIGSASCKSVDNSFYRGNLNLDHPNNGLAGGIVGINFGCYLFNSCLVTGQISKSSGTGWLSAISGTQSSSIIANNCYYLSGIPNSTSYGSEISDAVLKNGKPLVGFDESIWIFKEGEYPSLRFMYPTTYSLDINTTGNGNIFYSGMTLRNTKQSFSIIEGSSVTMWFSADYGYKIANVKVNNMDVTSQVKNNQYTVSNITANISVVVTFEKIPIPTYTLTVSASGNGEVSYSGENIRNGNKSFTLNEGTNATISFSPDNGYRIANVKVNNTDVTSQVTNNQYTVSSISANTTVAVAFEQIPTPTYTLTVTASGNGSATYDGTSTRNQTRTFTVNEGSSATVSFSPDNGYRIGSVKVNNTDVTANVVNNQYTISNILANTSVSVTFGDIEYDNLSKNGVNYRVVSNSGKTVNVASGSYGYWLTIPASFTANGFDWTVTGMDDDVLSSNPQLAAVIWNPSTLFTGSVDNPNFLLYVKSSQYAPSSIKNVVVNGTANNITLTDAANGNNFYCPQEFTAKQINYTHYYSMTTGIETAQGWESIALPFDVQSIIHPSKGTLVPFANWRSGSSERPFWLYQLSGNGFVVANSIQANRPYIISLPNNSEYREEYRVNGVITFSATDATVKSSENLQTGSYSDRTFIPNFINQNASNGFYVLNAINNYSTNAGGYTEGSRFVRNLRAVHPFEAYIASANNAKESFPIFEDTPTWIQLIENSKLIKDRVYNLSGQQVKIEGDQNYGSLRKGVYIVNGKKVVIK